MKLREEIENAIRMIEHEITILNETPRSHPDYPEAVRSIAVLRDRIKKLLETFEVSGSL